MRLFLCAICVNWPIMKSCRVFVPNRSNVPHPGIDGGHDHRDHHTRETELEEHAEGHGVTIRRADACCHQVRSSAHQRAVAAKAGSKGKNPRQCTHVNICVL